MPLIYYTQYVPVSLSVTEIESQEYFLGRALLITGLHKIFNLNYTLDELKDALSVSEYGKPHLPEHPSVHFSISHCDGLVVCAFDTHPIGVDVELPGSFEELLIKKILSSEEKDFLETIASTDELRILWFYKFWTLKEAYVKKTGTGITNSLSEFSFSFNDTCSPYSINCFDSSTACWQTVLDSGHIISVCYNENK